MDMNVMWIDRMNEHSRYFQTWFNLARSKEWFVKLGNDYKAGKISKEEWCKIIRSKYYEENPDALECLRRKRRRKWKRKSKAYKMRHNLRRRISAQKDEQKKEQMRECQRNRMRDYRKRKSAEKQEAINLIFIDPENVRII